MKRIFVLAALLTTQIAMAETIVCTGVLITGGNRVDISPSHTPIDIDSPPTSPEQYDTGGNFNGRKIVIENGPIKITANRSVNPTKEIVLDVWNGRTRANWASGAYKVSLGFSDNTQTERTYSNVECYTSQTWQGLNAFRCPKNSPIPDSIRAFCDELLLDRGRNFPEGF